MDPQNPIRGLLPRRGLPRSTARKILPTRALVLCAAVLGSWLLSTQVAFGEPERVRLRYEVDPSCPDRQGFVARVESSTRQVELTEEAASRVLEVSARRVDGSFTGALRLADAGVDGMARHVSGADCEEVIAALILIAVVAVDPSASRTPSANEVALPPPEGATIPAPAAPVAPRDGRRPAAPVEPAAVPRAARPHPVAHAPVPSSRGRRAALSASEGIHLELRTPEAPKPTLAGAVTARITSEGRWRPALALGVGYGQSSPVKAGAGEARFSLLFARLEAWPHLFRFGAFELGAALGFEGGRLEGKTLADRGGLVETRSSTAPWYALTQVLGMGWRPGAGFEIDGRVGVLEPLRRDWFYVDPPYETVHEIEIPGFLGGIGVAYRFD